jgi:hypothetical protein
LIRFLTPAPTDRLLGASVGDIFLQSKYKSNSGLKARDFNEPLLH